MRTKHHRLACLLVSALGVVHPGPGAAVGQRRAEIKPSRAEQARATHAEYHAIIEAYRAGDASAPRRILEWTPGRLADVLGLVSIPGPDEAPWNTQRLEAAAMLHTDGVLLRVEARDGVHVPMHLEVASRILAKGAPDTNEFARRWYVAVARLLRERSWLRHAEILLELGRERLPGDPVVLCESGTLQEYIATDRTVPAHAERPVFVTDGSLAETVRNARRWRLRRAVEWLEEASKAGSTDPFCRLHEARAWSLIGEDHRANAMLSGLQNDSDAAVSYLASMFLGAAAERLGDRAAAERHFREAVGRFAAGQSAKVALSAVLLASGRVAEARDILNQSVDDVPQSRREPWWWYHREPTLAVEARIEALLREVRR